jgi:hypothetical protein
LTYTILKPMTCALFAKAANLDGGDYSRSPNAIRKVVQMSESQNQVFLCSTREWTIIPIPNPASDDGKNLADAENKLRAEHPEGKVWGTACRARGDGDLSVDLEGIHWLPNRNNGKAKLELQVALMDGAEVRAELQFLKGGLDRQPKTAAE